MSDTYPVETIELVTTKKENDELKIKLHDALTKNREMQDHVMLLEAQLQNMKERMDEIMQLSTSCPDRTSTVINGVWGDEETTYFSSAQGH